MKIYIATEADIPALCQLLAELFEQEAEFQPDSAAQMRGLQQIIRAPAIGHIFVAKRERRVIGMVSLLYSISTALGGRVAWLEDMVVTADSRRSRIGSLLLTHALEFAHSSGCRRVTLLTDHDNLAAQSFYDRHGFRGSSMKPMRLMLEPK